jgi:hypothetical protein
MFVREKQEGKREFLQEGNRERAREFMFLSFKKKVKMNVGLLLYLYINEGLGSIGLS